MDYASPFYAQNKRLDWSNEELELLRQLYPNRAVKIKTICKKLSRSRGSVAGRARKLGLKRGGLHES